MNAKFEKFQTTRESARLLIQPRQQQQQHRADTVDLRRVKNEHQSDRSSHRIVELETMNRAQSNSSLVEIPCTVRSSSKRTNENLGDGFRAILKISDSYYELDVDEHTIGDYHDEELDSGKEIRKDINAVGNSEVLDTPTKSRMKKKRNAPSICLVGCRYSVITRVARYLGWKIVRDTDLWNIYWTESVQGVDMFKDMKRFQKVNHFPGMVEICRKDLLARNLTRMQRLFPEEYNFFPKTWCFPADFGEAINFSRQYKNRTYILKPDTGAQGRGIWLTRNLKEAKPNERMICQVYIHKPLLIDGYKFDLRVYCLITSVDPLRVFVYNEGLARFATSKYKEPTYSNTSDIFMHLTNYSVNKHSRSFCKDNDAGSKRKFSTLNRILLNEGYDVETLWSNIDDIIVKTILSAWHVLKHNYHACFPGHDVVPACFEILGFDILIDSKMKAYLLEVNHSPSFHTEETIDREVKEAMLRDAFQILNLSFMDKKKILKEDKRRVQTRLLQKIRESAKGGIDTAEINNNSPESSSDTTTSTPNLQQQIAWEESHLGNYRRVMPVPNDPDKYTPFIILKNQASIYSDTAASKRREEAAKQLRSELIQKALNEQKFLVPVVKKNIETNAADKTNGNHSENKTAEKRKKRAWTKKRMPATISVINEVAERERRMLMSQRDFLIRSSGIVEMIFENFYKNKLLCDSDRIKFQELYDKLEIRFQSQESETKSARDNLEDSFSSMTLNETATPCNCRLPSVKDQHLADNIGQYIASMQVGDSNTLCTDRVQSERERYSKLYHKIKLKDVNKKS